MAKSAVLLTPTNSAGLTKTRSPWQYTTTALSAPSITWRFVATCPWLEMMNPLPWEFTLPPLRLTTRTVVFCIFSATFSAVSARATPLIMRIKVQINHATLN